MGNISDIREDIVAKKMEGSTLEFAGFWRRLAAILIDLSAVAVICSIIILIFQPLNLPGLGNLWNFGFDIEALNENFWNALPYLIGRNVLSLLVSITYFVGFWVWRGQTPGKMLLSIKVIREDGSDVTIGVALLRCLGYIVSFATVLLGFIWIAFDDRKQGFHDTMAETYVVIIPRAPIAAPVAKASIGG